MEFKQMHDFSLLTNEAESMVIEELGTKLGDDEFKSVCTCDDCVLDMAAFALNHLKPVYRVSLLGSMYAHSMGEGDYKKEVTRSVEEAIRKIAANPSHD
jgi:competence protein ComFB